MGQTSTAILGGFIYILNKFLYCCSFVLNWVGLPQLPVMPCFLCTVNLFDSGSFVFTIAFLYLGLCSNYK